MKRFVLMPKFALLLLMLSLALLCYRAGAVENTTDYWANQAKELSSSGSDREAVLAYEKALTLINSHLEKNPHDYKAWIRKGLSSEQPREAGRVQPGQSEGLRDPQPAPGSGIRRTPLPGGTGLKLS